MAFLAGSSAQLSGLEVTGCSSGRGAGILVEASNITLSGVRLSNNTAMGAGSVGGGLALLDGSVATASDCEVEGNFAAKYGAGAYVHGSLLEVTGGRVKANRLTGAGRGAGVAAFAGSTVRLAGDASVEHNEGYFGGGVMAQASHLFMEGRSSVQNNAAMYGGGLVLVAALGSISGAELRGNEAAHFGGAALLESSVLRFRGGTCSGNSATLGGCYYCSNSTIEVEGSALDYNVAGGSGGVGAYVDCDPTAAQPCSSSLEIRGSSLRNNTAAEEGGALALRSVAVSLVQTELSGGGAARGGALACSGESSVSLHGSVASSNAAEEEGGAAFVGDGCVLTATGTEISGNEAQVRGGGAFVSGGGSLEADRASFRGNAAREGGAIFASGGAAFVAARDSNFTRNEAEESGGGVSVRGSPFEAQGSAFARNKANRGAAIAVVSDLAAHPVLLSGLRFEENIATDGSSAWWSRAASPLVDLECRGCDHAAASGLSNASHVATEAVALGFLVPPPAAIHSNEAVPSFSAGLLDAYGQVARTSGGHLCRLSATATPAHEEGGLLISSEGQAETREGRAAFRGLRVEGAILSDHDLELRCFPAPSSAGLAVTWRVRISGCRPGQEPSQDRRSCVPCKVNWYNFDGASCRPCPEGGVCPGGARLLAKPGWWRSLNDSGALYRCPKSRSCKEGEAFGEDSCEVGHRGPACALCLESYHEWGNTCRRCSMVSTYLIPLLALAALVFLVAVVLSSSNSAGNQAANSDSMVRVNILLSYCQVVGRINHYGFAWTPRVTLALGIFDYTNVAAKLTSPRCVESGTDFYDTYLMTAVIPLGVLVAYAAYYAASRARGRRKIVDLRSHCCRSVLWILTLVYVGVASVCLEVFGTTRVEGVTMLTADYGIVVREPGGGVSPRHKAMVALGAALLLLYPVGIPLLSYFLLRFCRRNPEYRGAVAFLTCGYRERHHYWEVLEMSRNLFVSVVPTLFPQNTALQVASAQCALVCFLVALPLCRPYKANADLLLQCAQLLTVWILISSGSLIEHGDLGAETRESVETLSLVVLISTLLLLAAECLAAMVVERARVRPAPAVPSS